MEAAGGLLPQALPWVVSLLAGLALLAALLGAFSAKKSVPGPRFRIPLLGDTIAFATSDPARFLFARFKRYGRVFRMGLLGFEAAVVGDAEALRPVLSDEAGRFTMPVATWTALLGDYSIMEHKDAHGPWRKLAMAALTGPGVQALSPRVAAVVAEHVAEWAAAGRLEAFEAARRLSLDLAVDVVSGVDLAGVDVAWFKKEMATFCAGLYGLPISLPGSPLAKAQAAKARMLAVLEPAVRGIHGQVQAEWDANGGSAQAVASQLLDSGEALSFERVQIFGFFARGCHSLRDAAMSVLWSVMTAADTTRFTLLNTWALVAMSPRVQDAIYEEQKQIIATHGPELSFRAVASSAYLEAAFKEAQRLFPSTTGSFRRLTRDLAVGGVTLPAGEVVWYHALLLHTLDPVLWDGDTSGDLPAHMDWRDRFEEAFQPERWLSDATRPRNFFLFGSGAHLCAGQQLATHEIKLVLAALIRRFHLRLEVPDMLRRARLFPYTEPAPGTDGIRLTPREAPLEC